MAQLNTIQPKTDTSAPGSYDSRFSWPNSIIPICPDLLVELERRAFQSRQLVFETLRRHHLILLAGMVSGRWQGHYKPVDISERGGLCPVMWAR